MKYLIVIIFTLIILACIGIAGYLVVQGKEGWGWFLFIAVIFGSGMSYSEKD